MLLSSFLPGLRDLRAPLATGYLWLATLWVMLRSKTPTGELQQLVDDVRSLADRAGAGACIAVVTFCAYLIGAVMTVERPPASLRRTISRLGEQRYGPYSQPTRRGWRRIERSLLSWVGHNSLVADGAENAYGLAWSRVQRLVESQSTRADSILLSGANLLLPVDLRRAIGDEADHFAERLGREAPDDWPYRDATVVARHVGQAIESELPALANRLQIERVEIFDRYDRLVAESEFRLACSVPLAALSIAIAWDTHSWWVLFGLAFAGALGAYGIRRGFDARAVVWESLDQGLITSTTLDTYERGVRVLLGEMPAEGNYRDGNEPPPF